jgi:hypothetical protein
MIKLTDQGNRKGVSKPRSIVKLDGQSVYFLDWTVNLNSTHQADDFTINLPFRIDQNQTQNYLVATPEKPSYLFTKSDVLVEIFVGFPRNPENYQSSDLKRIMYGNMDTAELNLSNSGEVVTLTGRNRVAPFLDTKSTIKYQNMTSSAIAGMLAKKYGLATSITPTYTLAGKYFAGDSTVINSDTCEWDLLAFLADQEGFELRVWDNTLYFGPFEKIIGNVTTDGLKYTWGQNIVDLTITRSPHAAKNLIIDVHSYNSKTGKHIKATAKKTGSSSGESFHQRYYYPGLTQDQAQKKATSILNQLSKLEIIGTLDVVGHEKLTVDRLLLLNGLGTGLSNQYYVRKASHTFNMISGGYQAQIDFSNLLIADENTGGM